MWASSRGVSAPVSTNDGTFTLDVPLNAGTNDLVVTVTDVTGNQSQQTRTVKKNALEIFHYDGNGNLTNWINGAQNWTYQWDWADRLTKVTSNSITVLENWYDAKSRRIAKAELVNGQMKRTLYLYSGSSVTAALNQDGHTMETYTRGVGLTGDVGTLTAITHHAASFTNGVFYTHHNHRGDIVVARRGAVTFTVCDYKPFGAMRSCSGTIISRFGFSSKEYDHATGLYYYGFRFYAPTWQRWLSRDPYGGNTRFLAHSQHTPFDNEVFGNLYLFVHNDPVNFHDPYGLRGYWSCVGKVLWCEALTLACPASAVLAVAGCIELCKDTAGTACACCWLALPAAIGAVCMEAVDCWSEAHEQGCVDWPPDPPPTWEPPGNPW